MVESSYDRSTFLSKLSFWWSRNYTQNPHAVFRKPKIIDIDHVAHKISNKWKKEQQNKDPSFFKALWKGIFWKYCIINIPIFIEVFSLIAISILLGRLVEYFWNDDDISTGFTIGFGIIILFTISRLCRNLGNFHLEMFGFSIKCALLKLMNKKLCRLSHEVINSGDVSSRVVNLTGTYLQAYDFFSTPVYTLVTPFAAIAIFLALYYYTGYAGVLGLLLMTTMWPITTKLSHWVIKLKLASSRIAESRIKKTNEVIDTIKFLKSYTWEYAYADLIFQLRDQELKQTRRRAYIKTISKAIGTTSISLGCILTFGIIYYNDGYIDYKIVTPTLTFLLLGEYYIAIVLPVAIEYYWNSYRGLVLLGKFLLEKEHQKLYLKYPKGEIMLKNVTSYWTKQAHDEEEGNFCLRDINLTIHRGEMCVIYGQVGSGKTSLMLSLLGEMHIEEGEIYRGGKVAYVPQEPWIFRGTVKENIVMERPYDETDYRHALYYSMLEDDISKFKNGDETIIGDKGSNISGGQKTRINLARAIYSQADIYIFDDPLSSIDIRIAREIYDRLIIGYLNEKTRVLVTHLIDYIHDYTKVYKMIGGVLQIETSICDASPINGKKVVIEVNAPNIYDKKTHDAEKSHHKSWESFYKYFKLGWCWSSPLIIFFIILASGLYTLMPWWIYYWSEKSKSDQKSSHFYWALFAIGLGLVLASVIRNALVTSTLLESAKKLHNISFAALISAPLHYFTHKSQGFLMNRFSNDIEQVDEYIPTLIAECIGLFFFLIGSFVMMIISDGYLSIALVPILIACIYNFNKSNRYLDIFNATYNASKAPIVSHLSSTASGLYCLRSYKLLSAHKQSFRAAVERSAACFFAQSAAMRWMLFLLDIPFIALIASYIIISVPLKGTLSAATLGSGLSFVQRIGMQSAYAMYTFRKVKNSIYCITELLKNLKIKPEDNSYEAKLEITKGEIEFRDVVVAYDDGTRALNSMNVIFEGGCKIGIVGRSGSGKTSIINTLLRFVEIQQGQVLIDGMDISQANLTHLRKCITVIPQTPIIFHNSVIYNMDPLNEYNEDEIWTALQLVGMDEKISVLLGGLHNYFSSKTLSAGEKQLFCLARALLRQNKIFVMDEITSNVDYGTEEKIYETVDATCGDCTALIIAHRLDFILTCDFVMIVNEGACSEYGNPKELLKDRTSALHHIASFSNVSPTFSTVRRNSLALYMSTLDSEG
ncbi:unnamed protein product [Blepharisma stoltei]|uniref:Uncharacterized protein n=1 Tax=Blepharisma stoltei TaxID=1481888 RepID=A0AAU9IAK9_9CILI|nr:unnamed protein product [Blepharisma stoltei]